ncbi:unnamed protein product [Bursaphelenchus okinawaensis]|uniref:G-protein coupled receptors family 1 profile domain-containing protein n=1 Tax=Bursaphelenchus okinawaensis TaxID=465554 RepID=A0A811LKM0_9BILA|nr:unnamed protein product [Bursaphelenchus okinawaensis]CAG9125594.1 unnamed protein product [Bursaphelenchus okinawaensis]
MNRSDITWLGDILFNRSNRSIKYLEDGNIYLLNEFVEWQDIKIRLSNNWSYMVCYATSMVFNFVWFLMSLRKKKHEYYQKVNIILANLAFTNFILSTGFLFYTFLIDIYYDVDSFNTLISINQDSVFYQIWPISKIIIHKEMVESFSSSQSIVMFMLSVDRYCALFPNYCSFVKRMWMFVILALTPYILSMILLDEDLSAYFMNTEQIKILKLVFWLTPTLLALIFTSCSVARLLQDSYSSNPNHNLPCSVSLFLLLIIQIVEKFGHFLNLLHENFRVHIVVGSSHANQVLDRCLSAFYSLSDVLLLYSPLIQAIFFLLSMKLYRKKMMRMGDRLIKCFRCKRKPKLDYNSETMKSIIAEQKRFRQMNKA